MEQSYNPNPTPYGGMPPAGPPPKNWLVESILVTIFCCLPFGIVGIIKAANVNSKHMGGDVNGALADSASAGKWTKIGFFSGIAVYVIYGLMMVLGIGGAIMSGSH
jgi:hypothetical protein